MENRNKRFRLPMIVAVAMISGASLAAGTLALSPVKGADLAIPDLGGPGTTSLATAKALSDDFARVVEKAAPAVVFIEVEKEPTGVPAGNFGEGDPRGMNPFEFFFGPNGPQGGPEGMPFRRPMPFGNPGVRGQGSGFVVTPDGFIVTNHHVVGDMDRVRVTLADGRRFDAKVIGSDPQTEIALIKIEAKDLPTVSFADSEKLRVGEWVLAIGSPFGLTHSVTQGIVSARGRGNVGIVDYADFIQTDAAINPGNSGGPLLNLDGEVVGMNTAILSPSGSSAGVGFAIPVNMIRHIVDQLRDHGSVTRGYLGIAIQDLTPDLARWFGVDQNRGVLVADVSDDSPAARAGLQRDDLIVELNGNPVGESGSFRSHVAATSPGNELKLAIIRGGQRLEKSVKVGTLPGQPEAPAAAEESTEVASQGKLGVSLQPLTDELAAQLNAEGEQGLVVTGVAPGSPAARAGLQPGALIQEVNRKPVKTVNELKQALKDGSQNGTALLLVREGEGSRYVAVDIA